MKVSIPEPKLQKTKNRIQSFLQQDKATIHQYQQLLGSLNYLAQIMPAGRTFLFYLRQALARDSAPFKFHQIPPAVKEDLKTWLNFINMRNASYSIHYPRRDYTSNGFRIVHRRPRMGHGWLVWRPTGILQHCLVPRAPTRINGTEGTKSHPDRPNNFGANIGQPKRS